MATRAPVNKFQLTISSHVPALSMGASITPGNNAYGTYVQLIAGASVTDDASELWICINSMSVSGAARDALVKVGMDPAGGTTYGDVIVGLQASCASNISGTGGGGIWYKFPLRVKAGTSIAMAASVNNATVGTCLAMCKLRCKPTRPELVRVGHYVRTFGDTLASSSGTVIAPANGSKGTYVQIGSAVAAGDALWFWNVGLGLNNAVFNNNAIAVDLAVGDATNKRIVIPDQLVIPNTGETLSYVAIGDIEEVSPGELVYARALTTGTPATVFSAAGYAVGG